MEKCLCRSRRPHVDCPVHGPVECLNCGSRMARCHAEGCGVIEPDDGTPPETERPDAAAPKEVRERIDADQETLYGYPGEVIPDAAAPPSDAAQPEEGCEFCIPDHQFFECPKCGHCPARILSRYTEDAPRITMTKSYLSGRQCCDFTIAEDDSETHEEGCPWRLVDEFAKAVREWIARQKSTFALHWIDSCVVALVEDMANSPIRHPEDAPEGPFHAKPSDVRGDSRWMVTYQDEKTGCIYVTEGECKDIRDVLNRHALNREVRDSLKGGE